MWLGGTKDKAPVTIRRSWLTYLLALLVFLLSICATVFLPIPDMFRGLASVPGVAALLGLVVQISRDQVAHERRLTLQQEAQSFTVSTASHMAIVAFDKHVIFCEAYFGKMNSGLKLLFGAGPTADALTLAEELKSLRGDFSPWLTEDIENQLFPFEHALRKIGAQSRLLEHLEVGDKRTQIVNQMYEAFGIVIGMQKAAADEQTDIAATKILDHLRGILGIRELTALRRRALDSAMARGSNAEAP